MATDLIFIQTEPYNYNSPFERMHSQSHGNLNSNSHSQNNRNQIHTGNLKNSIKNKEIDTFIRQKKLDYTTDHITKV